MVQEADEVTFAAQHQNEASPLRLYLAALYQGDVANQLLRQIGVYVWRAKLVGEQQANEIALEVLNETIAIALKVEERFDPTRSPYAWLLGIANKIVMQRRDKLFRLNRNESVHSDLTYGTSSPGGGSYSGVTGGVGGRSMDGPMDEEAIMERLLARHSHPTQPSLEQQVTDRITLEALLTQLALEERRVIELNIVHELKAAEVARELGIQEVNARVRLTRALKKLRTIYMAQVQGEPPNDRLNQTPGNSASGPLNDGKSAAVNQEEKQSHE